MTAEVTYLPVDTLKAVGHDVWIVDSAMESAGLRLPVRMTVIRLRNGDVLLHSPTRFSSALLGEIEALGPIRHLVAPNSVHWTFLRDWQAGLSGVLTWAAPGLRERRPVRRSGVRLDRDLGEREESDWPVEVKRIAVRGGFGFCETALNHQPSRTLVLTDLIQAFEPAKLPFAFSLAVRLAGSAASRGGTPIHLKAVIKLAGEPAREAARRLVALEPERVIFAHGLWFDHDGASRLRRALAWLS